LTDTACRWDAADGSGSVSLNASTIRELRAKAIEAFLSLPRRGVEIGGLLFGNEQDGHPFVQRFEEVSCEHRYGPSFTLSEGDHVELTGKLARSRREESLPVIGFYRSYTGRRALVEAADRALMREHFPNGEAVFLLLQPIDARNCSANFRICRDGEFLDAPVSSPVFFDPESIDKPAEPAGRPVEREADVEPTIQPSHATQPDRPFVIPSRTLFADEPEPSHRWWPALAACLLGVAAGVGLHMILAPEQPRWVDLYLSAKPSADTHTVQLTWDAAAAKTAGVTHALLGVSDGTAHHQVPLSLPDIQLGAYTYAASSPDLEFRMTLYGRGPALSGGVLRMSPAAQAPAVIAPAAATPAEPQKQAEEPKPAPKVDVSRKAVREVQPSVPEGIRARIAGEVRIPVTVTINGRGQVTAATTPRAADGLQSYLGQQSVKAARQWRFARASASPVAEKTIYFTFRR
jgi:hypothetical protein